MAKRCHTVREVQEPQSSSSWHLVLHRKKVGSCQGTTDSRGMAMVESLVGSVVTGWSGLGYLSCQCGKIKGKEQQLLQVNVYAGMEEVQSHKMMGLSKGPGLFEVTYGSIKSGKYRIRTLSGTTRR